jgi:hypothetical protein
MDGWDESNGGGVDGLCCGFGQTNASCPPENHGAIQSIVVADRAAFDWNWAVGELGGEGRNGIGLKFRHFQENGMFFWRWGLVCGLRDRK